MAAVACPFIRLAATAPTDCAPAPITPEKSGLPSAVPGVAAQQGRSCLPVDSRAWASMKSGHWANIAGGPIAKANISVAGFLKNAHLQCFLRREVWRSIWFKRVIMEPMRPGCASALQISLYV